MQGIAKGLYINIMRSVELLESSNKESSASEERLNPTDEMKIRKIAVNEVNKYTGLIAAGIGSCDRIRTFYKDEHGKDMDCSGCKAVKNFNKAVESYSSTFEG